MMNNTTFRLNDVTFSLNNLVLLRQNGTRGTFSAVTLKDEFSFESRPYSRFGLNRPKKVPDCKQTEPSGFNFFFLLRPVDQTTGLSFKQRLLFVRVGLKGCLRVLFEL